MTKVLLFEIEIFSSESRDLGRFDKKDKVVTDIFWNQLFFKSWMDLLILIVFAEVLVFSHFWQMRS